MVARVGSHCLLKDCATTRAANSGRIYLLHHDGVDWLDLVAPVVLASAFYVFVQLALTIVHVYVAGTVTRTISALPPLLDQGFSPSWARFVIVNHLECYEWLHVPIVSDLLDRRGIDHCSRLGIAQENGNCQAEAEANETAACQNYKFTTLLHLIY